MIVVKKTVTELVKHLSIYNIDGDAEKVLAFLSDAVANAKMSGYTNLRFDFECEDDYGDMYHTYQLSGTRNLTQAELDRNTAKRERDRANAAKSKAKAAEVQQAKDLKLIKRLAKKYPAEMREQMLAIGE